MSPGRLVWITGLAGSGKTTLAQCLSKKLWSEGSSHILLDGDQFREMMGNELGHSREDRLINAQRLARCAHFLASQGCTVVCATVSLFREIHNFNRKHVENYIEVFVDCDPTELRRRDKKGLYSNGGGETVGVGQDYERPLSPNLVIRNNEKDQLTPNVEQIYHALRRVSVGSH